MSQTVSVAYDPDLGVWDLDGQSAAGLEALRQRIVQAIYLRAREWFLQRSRGLDRSLVLGHRINTALAAAEIGAQIIEEGGNEVIALHDVEYSIDRTTRTFRYSVRVESIWGNMLVSQSVSP